MLEQKIRTAGKTVIKNEEKINDDFLIELMKDFHIDELNWMNENGEILYSSIEQYLGWTTFKGHPLYDFVRSKDQELIEDIRPDSEFGIPFKYGAIKNENGYFVQVGILAENIYKLTQRFDYQTLVEELAQEENIIYATIVDTNLKAIADADIEDIGIIYDAAKETQLQQATNGTISTDEWFYPKIGKKVLEVTAPIFINKKITGALVLGLSMDSVYSSVYTIFITSSIISIMIFLLFLWIQNKNIIRPVNQLNYNINQIDMENNIEYRLPLVENDTFWGLSLSINNLLDKSNTYLYQLKENQHNLKISNQEILAAYQQLTASDEELRAQYDEIQNYTSYIEYLAYNDDLTNLPNRRSFLEKLEESINKNQSGAVMLLDLDNFKEINDTLGHTYGDKVLITVAQALINIKDEQVFVSRFGGDEFLVLIEGENDISIIENYAKKITNIFKNDFMIDENEIYIGCSIGITQYPFDSNQVNQLIINADLAMYKVKALGKNSYMFFKKEMTEKLKKHIEIERILREAITENGFKLLYQPQVCTYTGKIVGFEALLRLKNHSISPAVFIPTLEENGMIIEVGRWVTKEIINQIALWRNNGVDVKSIAINFSAKQLDDSNYITFLENELKKKNVESKYIEIEITESIFLDKKEETITFLNKLRRLGIKIALDDFGTGYSSLSYLTFLPVDKMKLDKSLCDKFLEMENIAIMDNIISLAHSLNLEVLAEGIEDIEQYNRLKVGGCNYIQGYLFSKPVEVTEVEKIYNTVYLEKKLP
ncbi:EAL domain-containing protein [Tepidibacter hydrothermalis]|uniref:EAL domain-containing protein n=1 Tax=Tepidibacter hydrothermalis TaxID=3036126 RepID=A0ABY8EI69_9FIRM|nr:EAL domain-containing protein [Tepidibacter hydrothermalis]WFD10560.1 EAL domain-containing protein [Tepidibacter hydrothermalis]